MKTAGEIRAELRDAIKACGMTQRRASREIGCHQTYLSLVLQGHKPPSPNMARWLGYERVQMYRRIDDGI